MYENLLNSKIISLDIETFDPDLSKMGPGVYRSKPLDFKNANGYILGISVGNERGEKGYYNLGHYDCTEEERAKNIAYLTPILASEITKIGQNLMYDLDWIENWLMVPVNGKLIDIGIAEALLDENQRFYNLDFMGNKYFGEGKKDGILIKFCQENNLKAFRGSFVKWLYRMPYYMAVEYAIQDIDLPLKIWELQEKKLKQEELTDLMELECGLLRVLLKMRKTGVHIDPDIRQASKVELETKVSTLHKSLIERVGCDFNFNSTNHLAFVFEQNNIQYAFTEKGNPSIKRDHLMKLSKGQMTDTDGNVIEDAYRQQLGNDLAEVRRAAKILGTFVDGSLIDFITPGDLIHCSFYNTMTDQFGTRSGRFSSANPNLQQIPSPGVDEYYGKLTRRPFTPFENSWWGKLDYSQIEYRFMAHFAKGPGSDEVRAQYNANARTDYHQYIVDLTGLKRRYAKNLNFGVAYGMGAKHMAEFFQWPLDYCYDILDIYHGNAPFIKSTIKAVEQASKSRGYIKTFLNRRSRLLDPNKAYTMFCRLTQGSAADLMKKALYETNKASIFDVLPPHITVHDEIDVSVPKTKEGIEAFKEAKNIMENCVDLRVPIVADMEIGANWADVEEIDDTQVLDKMLKEN